MSHHIWSVQNRVRTRRRSIISIADRRSRPIFILQRSTDYGFIYLHFDGIPTEIARKHSSSNPFPCKNPFRKNIPGVYALERRSNVGNPEFSETRSSGKNGRVETQNLCMLRTTKRSDCRFVMFSVVVPLVEYNVTILMTRTFLECHRRCTQLKICYHMNTND